MATPWSDGERAVLCGSGPRGFWAGCWLRCGGGVRLGAAGMRDLSARAAARRVSGIAAAQRAGLRAAVSIRLRPRTDRSRADDSENLRRGSGLTNGAGGSVRAGFDGDSFGDAFGSGPARRSLLGSAGGGGSGARSGGRSGGGERGPLGVSGAMTAAWWLKVRPAAPPVACACACA